METEEKVGSVLLDQNLANMDTKQDVAVLEVSIEHLSTENVTIKKWFEITKETYVGN